MVPDTRVPVVLLRLIMPAGAENDPADAPGLSALTASMLDEGTSRRSSVELAEAAERLGGYLSTAAAWDSSHAETSLLTPDLALGLDLISDVVMDPTFPGAEVERLKLQTQAHLRRRSMQPAAIASDAFALALYGTGPYSRPLLGTEASVENMERDHLVEFHSKRSSPDGAALIVAGSFSTPQIEDTIERTLGSWNGKRPTPALLPDPQSHPGLRIVLVDRPDAPQSEICLGHVGLRRGDPDFIPATVMNSLLGGKFTSRINLNLRERHGFTYGAHSYLARRHGPGPFTITAAVENEAVAQAIREVLHELNRLQQEPVPPAELEETVDYLIGSFPYSCETLSGVVNRLHSLVVHDFPEDYYEGLPEALATVTSEDIGRCARAHLHPETALIVVVGPAAQIEEPLADIAPVIHQ
jgi:zinc protease